MGGYEMPRIRLPADNAKRKAWKKGRLIGQKRPLLPQQVWAMPVRRQLAGDFRDLALIKLATNSRGRGCDPVQLRVCDRVTGDRVRERVTIAQGKTNRSVQFEVPENTREAIANWVNPPDTQDRRCLFPSRVHASPHPWTRQCV